MSFPGRELPDEGEVGAPNSAGRPPGTLEVAATLSPSDAHGFVKTFSENVGTLEASDRVRL